MLIAWYAAQANIVMGRSRARCSAARNLKGTGEQGQAYRHGLEVEERTQDYEGVLKIFSQRIICLLDELIN